MEPKYIDNINLRYWGVSSGSAAGNAELLVIIHGWCGVDVSASSSRWEFIGSTRLP